MYNIQMELISHIPQDQLEHEMLPIFPVDFMVNPNGSKANLRPLVRALIPYRISNLNFVSSEVPWHSPGIE